MIDRHAERLLVFLLRLGGGVMLFAFGAVFLPVDWMRASHEWLGLGPFPASPLVDYLTRSIAVLYGIQGGVWLVGARDVLRHAPVLSYLATMNVVFGVLIVGIDLHAGMPHLWTLTEGPPIALFGLVVLGLLRRVAWQALGGLSYNPPNSETGRRHG